MAKKKKTIPTAEKKPARTTGEKNPYAYLNRLFIRTLERIKLEDGAGDIENLEQQLKIIGRSSKELREKEMFVSPLASVIFWADVGKTNDKFFKVQTEETGAFIRNCKDYQRRFDELSERYKLTKKVLFNILHGMIEQKKLRSYLFYEEGFSPLGLIHSEEAPTKTENFMAELMGTSVKGETYRVTLDVDVSAPEYFLAHAFIEVVRKWSKYSQKERMSPASAEFKRMEGLKLIKEGLNEEDVGAILYKKNPNYKTAGSAGASELKKEAEKLYGRKMSLSEIKKMLQKSEEVQIVLLPDEELDIIAESKRKGVRASGIKEIEN